MIIPIEAPWIVEIDGVKYAAPDAVCLLLKDVSEERDLLREIEEAAREFVSYDGQDIYHGTPKQGMRLIDALRAAGVER